MCDHWHAALYKLSRIEHILHLLCTLINRQEKKPFLESLLSGPCWLYYTLHECEHIREVTG